MYNDIITEVRYHQVREDGGRGRGRGGERKEGGRERGRKGGRKEKREGGRERLSVPTTMQSMRSGWSRDWRYAFSDGLLT